MSIKDDIYAFCDLKGGFFLKFAEKIREHVKAWEEQEAAKSAE